MKHVLRRPLRAGAVGLAALGLAVGMLAAGSGTAFASANKCKLDPNGSNCITVDGTGLLVHWIEAAYDPLGTPTVCGPEYRIWYWIVQAPSEGGTSHLYHPMSQPYTCYPDGDTEFDTWHAESDFPDDEPVCATENSWLTNYQWSSPQACATIHS